MVAKPNMQCSKHKQNDFPFLLESIFLQHNCLKCFSNFGWTFMFAFIIVFIELKATQLNQFPSFLKGCEHDHVRTRKGRRYGDTSRLHRGFQRQRQTYDWRRSEYNSWFRFHPAQHSPDERPCTRHIPTSTYPNRVGILDGVGGS